jgi:protease stability complex PrcB-like protein
LKSLLATALVLLVIGGLVLVRTINIDRNYPIPVAPTPAVHSIKQLLLPGPVPFQTLFWNMLGRDGAGVTAINDPNTWAALWRNQTLCYISNSCSNLPKIDFDSRTVLIVRAGLQGNPGYRINVISVIATHDQVLVDAILTTPGLYCAWIQVITFPAQVIEIPQTSLPLIFNMTQEQAPACPY